MAPNVAVIGAGVNGLSTAYALKLRDPQLKVTIFSDKFTPDVVSDVAGGFWQVVMAGDTPEELVRYVLFQMARWLDLGPSIKPPPPVDLICI